MLKARAELVLVEGGPRFVACVTFNCLDSQCTSRCIPKTEKLE